jgi:hypothetical protein
VGHLMAVLWKLPRSVARELVAHWYGSVRDPHVLVPFAAVLALGVGYIATLQPYGDTRRLGGVAGCLLGLSLGLEGIRRRTTRWRVS